MEHSEIIEARPLTAWEQASYAFLAEKERRSGSRRTVDAYSRTLQRFFGTLGKTPDQVTSPDVFGFAHGTGPSGRKPAAITIGARLACISSFYRFLMRMGLLAANPCDQLERPRTSPSPPRGLSADEIRRLLAGSPGDGSRPPRPRRYYHAGAYRPPPNGNPEPQGNQHHPGWRALLHI